MNIKNLNEKLEEYLDYIIVAYKGTIEDNTVLKYINTDKQNLNKNIEKLRKLNPDFINVYVERSGQLDLIRELN